MTAPADAQLTIHETVSLGRRARRHRWARAAAAIVVVLGIAGPAAYHYVFQADEVLPETGRVPIPPQAASPRQVAVAYIRALELHDAATARALVQGPNMPGVTTYYLQRLRSIETFHIQGVTLEPHSLGCDVNLQWDLHWTHPNYLDKDGPQAWEFVMVRSNATSRWLITDDGTG